MLEEIYKLFLLLDGLDDQEIEVDGCKISINKEGNSISISAEPAEDYSELLEVIADYKESVIELDDDTFIEVVDEMSEVIDIKEFDRLLGLDNFTEEEAISVEKMIECSSNIINDKLTRKINELIELRDRF